MLMLYKFLAFFIDIYIWIVLIRIIMSWVQAPPGNPIDKITSRLTDPILMPMRRILPMLRISGMLLDFSPILLLISLALLKRLLFIFFTGM